MSSSEIPYIIGTSPHDALMTSLFILVGKFVHAPGQLSGNSHSEQRCQSRCSDHPFYKGHIVASGAYHDIELSNVTDSFTYSITV